MRRSDQQSSDEDEFNANVSLDETANSIHQQNIDQDKEMAELNTPLARFIAEQLKVQLKLDGLEHESLFKEKECIATNPIPSLYFLAHHILVFNRNRSITDIREDILKLKKEYVIRYYNETEELYIKLHSHAELVHYNIRMVKTDPSLHKMKQFLDHRHLIDKLFQYYCIYYEKVYFQQTASLILYWAYQKQILNHELSEQAIKLIVICIFVNFGYGVSNVVSQHLSNQEILKQSTKMQTYAKINQKGETDIDPQLINRYTNYTIEEKRGFYMASKKKFMQLKDIIPIYFPIVPLPATKDAKEREETLKNISPVLNNGRQRMSICKNIFKIFKFLHNKFDKRMKLVIDFEQSLAYRQQFAENFELEILHPVLNNSICCMKDQSVRKLKNEINSVYEGFIKSQPITVMKEMMGKNRNH